MQELEAQVQLGTPLALLLLAFAAGVVAGVYAASIAAAKATCNLQQQRCSGEEAHKVNGHGKEGAVHRIKTPTHIAVIMDGNRRFGRQKHSDPLQGHWDGGQRLIDFVSWCIDEGVSMLTVFAFSSENWSRDPKEVTTLMSVFSKYAKTFETEALQRNIRIRVLSTHREKLPENVQQAIATMENNTNHCTGFQMNVCISYGARAEISQACKQIAAKVHSAKLAPEDICEDTLSEHMLTSGLPDPDLLIRTSGEFRLSNFLLYQAAYSELFFVNKFWPEITREDLTEILDKYCARHRRFGS